MIRYPLLQLLEAYHTTDKAERIMLENTILFIQQHPDCFERSQLKGHITGSAWILNQEKTHSLMMHHRKLNKWFQPGGHCDGDPDVMRVAAKEAFEETGVEVRLLSDSIFDVDHHIIPERNGVPEHIHYDIRFLFEADNTVVLSGSNSEAISVKWIPLQEVERYNDTPSIMRLVKKSSKLYEHF